LSSEQEQLIAKLSPAGRSAWDRLATETLIGTTVTVDGRSRTLTDALALRSNPDRDLRRRASEAIGAALRTNLALRLYILNMLLLEKTLMDTMRGYPTWLSARNEENELTDATVEAMVSAVTSRFGLVHRYYRAKRQLLGLNQLFDWDRFVNVGGSQSTIPWSEARELVTEAYAGFSPRIAEIVDQLFEQRVINGGNREGSGGFCQYIGPGLPPYISLNYTGRLENVLTLGHELGHGAHIWLSGERNRAIYYEPPQVMSETASLFGESLVLRELLRRADAGSKILILCRQVEQIIEMVFRNVAFHRFEGDLYRARDLHGELSVEEITSLWLEHNRFLYGDAVDLTAAYEPLWCLVSHILRFPGYLYAYSFGNLFALGLLARWTEVGTSFVNSYLNLLSAGGSMPPPVMAKEAGVDIGEADFWDRALDYIETKVAEVEAISHVAPRLNPEG
jgi:oligoendopeptidase F